MKAQYIKIVQCGQYWEKAYYSDKAMTILHREDGHAMEGSNKSKIWFINGKHHREDGPAIIWEDGQMMWYIHGKLHREDGPAIVWPNGKGEAWYLNGKRHREDGPAFIIGRIDDYPEKEWYIHGKQVTQAEHTRLTKKVPTININGKDFTLEELNSLIEIAEGNKV